MKKRQSVHVTRPYLPPKEEFLKRIEQIYDARYLTNQGPLLDELEGGLRDFLGVRHLQMVSNGTTALQLAIHMLDLRGKEVITTPYTYVASVSSLLWEGARPVFADIEPDGFNIDPAEIEKAITPDTAAILGVHVYGLPCRVEAIEEIARAHKLKVIYDAAHAFGTRYQGRALLDQGDVSICSFHATKVFHSGEGGCVVCRDAELDRRIELARRFGHHGDKYFFPGINAKSTELHAAMGLAVLPHFPEVVELRRKVCERYDAGLAALAGAESGSGAGILRLHASEASAALSARTPGDWQYNYSYYPVVFPDRAMRDRALARLAEIRVFPRRYFEPSLNQLPYLANSAPCPRSENMSGRVVCLPLCHDLEPEIIDEICATISAACRE
ncbi:DegT/DnrJ/EryC1/StrS family aminotransferase [Desulfovibrio sp. OttesenSCG-928-C06]|nr:DegT/DnrJ/EryC1/StrS family aminotransferase [Desulfovibrio sp. OttesenSCG-928-C06]